MLHPLVFHSPAFRPCLGGESVRFLPTLTHVQQVVVLEKTNNKMTKIKSMCIMSVCIL